jgi:hypothetical protein
MIKEYFLGIDYSLSPGQLARDFRKRVLHKKASLYKWVTQRKHLGIFVKIAGARFVA